MEPLDYLRIIVGRWKIVAAAVVVALLVGFASTLVPATRPQSNNFTATATLLAEGTVPDLGTVAAIATSDRVINALRQEVAPGETDAAVAQRVEATVSPIPGILQITARSRSAEEATQLANALAAEVSQAVEEMSKAAKEASGAADDASGAEGDPTSGQDRRDERRLVALEKRFAKRIAEARSPTELRKLEVLLALRSSLLARRIAGEQTEDTTAATAAPAEEPGRLRLLNEASAVEADAPADPPRRVLKLVIALGLGLLLGSALALLVENADRRLRTDRQAEAAFGYPVVSALRTSASGRNLGSRYRALLSPLKILMATLPARQGAADGGSPSGGRSYLVTAPQATVAKTAIAASAAVAAAQLGHRVVLVGWESATAPLSEIVREKVRSGVGEALRSADPLQDAAQSTGIKGLRLVGGLEGSQLHPSADEDDLDRLLNNVRKTSDVGVIDGGPLLASAETALMAQKVDVILIVVALGETKEADALRTSQLLHRLSVPAVGLVSIGSA